MQPLGERVLVQVESNERMSRGGIIVPGTGGKQISPALVGVVVRIGPEVMTIKPGEVVAFPEFCAFKLPPNVCDGKFCTVAADDVHLRIREAVPGAVEIIEKTMGELEAGAQPKEAREQVFGPVA